MNCMKIWNKFIDNFYNLFIKNLFRFRGRANRKEYIIRTLTFAMLLGSLKLSEIYYDNTESILVIGVACIHLFIVIVYILQFFFLLTRRLHDCNINGWWQLITFIPIGKLLFIIMIFYKGNLYANKYGEPPEY